jgi:hypothetical protein
LLDPTILLRELDRVLKPEGSLIVSTLNLGYWLSRLRLLVGRAPLCTNGVAPGFRHDSWVDPTHLHVCLLDEWLHYFAQAGWYAHSIRGAHLHFGGRRRMLQHLVDAVVDRSFPSLSLIPVVRFVRAANRGDSGRVPRAICQNLSGSSLLPNG